MDFLFSDVPASIVGFAYGFLDSICANKKPLDSPLSAVASATINGLVYGFGATLVSCIIPKPAKPVLPTILALSIAKKHHVVLTGVFNDIKAGSLAGVKDIQINGAKKLDDVVNDVKETTTEIINKAKEKMA